MLKSLLALVFVASGFSLTSQAQAGTCSTGFIEAYKKVIVEIKTIGVAIKAKKQPDNLVSAVRSCNRLENSFNGYRCEVGTQSAGTEDLQSACAQIRELAKSIGVEVPNEAPAPKTAETNTPVSTLAAKGFAIRINNAAQFTKVITAPKSIYFVNGQVYDLASSVLAKSEVRCTLAFPGVEKSANAAQAGQVLKANLITETVAHDNYYTRIALDDVNWTLDCAKHAFDADSSATGLTYGELKAALGNNADLAYQN